MSSNGALLSQRRFVVKRERGHLPEKTDLSSSRIEIDRATAMTEDPSR